MKALLSSHLPLAADQKLHWSLQSRGLLRIPQRSCGRAPLGPRCSSVQTSSADLHWLDLRQNRLSHTYRTASSYLHHSGPERHIAKICNSNEIAENTQWKCQWRLRLDLVSFGQLSKFLLSLWIFFVGVRVILLGHLRGHKHTVNYCDGCLPENN